MDSTLRLKKDSTGSGGLKGPSLVEPRSELRDKLQKLLGDKSLTSIVRSPAKGSFLHRVCYMIPKDRLDELLRSEDR